MQKLTLTDPNGYAVHAPDTVPFIVTTDQHVDEFLAYLLDKPATIHAAHLRAITAPCRNAPLIYQPGNYRVRVEPITRGQVTDLVDHYARQLLTADETPCYAVAAYGLPLAGLLGDPELRGDALYAAARDSLSGLAAA